MSWNDTKYVERPMALPYVDYDPRRQWKMGDGTVVVIKTMTDSHLRNCLRLLHRAANAWSLMPGALGPDVNEDEGRGLYAEAVASAKPGELIILSPFGAAGIGLLDEWARRGYYPDTWWAQ